MTYSIGAIWEGAYNIDVIITNMGDTAIHNWALLLYLGDNNITNIWNAKVANDEEGIYLLENNIWNMDIPVSGSINFGFTASYDSAKLYLPKTFAVTSCEKEVSEENYDIVYCVDSNGGGVLTATVKVCNVSGEDIEDWKLSFCYQNNINDAWCANMESKTTMEKDFFYCFRNPGWIQNINAGNSYSFGFIADIKNEDAIPRKFKMKSYDNSIDYERDSDDDGVGDVSEIVCGTNPYKKDTDKDGLNDGLEIFQLGLNPLISDTDEDNVLDGDEDSDQDQLSNIYELEIELEPWNDDTDGDGLLDGEEMRQYRTDPNCDDTDGDTLLDGQEIKLDLCPSKQDTDGDTIRDDKEKVKQQLIESISENDNDGAITKVKLDMKVTGDIEENTVIENVYDNDILSSKLEGLIGVPVNIESDGVFDKATITFEYDESKLIDVSEDDLAIVWYDDTNDEYVIYEEESVLDKKNRTISFTTTHFSTYMIVNKKKWYDIWRNEINYHISTNDKEYVDIVLAVDASGSMKGSDIKHAKTALKEFVDAKRGKDRCSVIQFTDTAEVLGGFKKSIKKIIKDIDEISVGGKTDVDKGLSRAIKQFTKANYKDVGNSKAILLVCDGDLEYNQEIVDKANKNDISIYTVLVGDKQDINLKKISENTGGSFFSVKNASDLSAAIFKMEKNIIGTVDTTDSDGDGIYDVYEEKGMLCSNGKIVRTDKNKMDSDRDGLSDYYEMTGFEYNSIPLIPIRKNIYLKKTDEYIEASCFSYRSNPNKMDTDGDEYDDKIDKRPLKRDVKLIGIKSNRNFVPIWKGKEGASWSESWDDEYVAYGGNQSWWEKQDEKFSESGCGIIAASNVLRYHQRKGENLIIPISKESYMQYTNRLKKHIYYLPFVGGTAGINIDHGIEKYCDLYHLNYASDVESSVFSEEKREKMQKRMIKEIKKKNPIILSVGPKVIGGVEEKYKVKMRKDNGSLITFGQLKKLYSHYVTVTGIIINEHNNTIKLQVSSWGDKYYVDLNDIYEYVDNYGDSYTCDVIFVDKK